MSNKRTFEFGKNWASYSQGITLTQVEDARESLIDLIGQGLIKGKSFLDIGCGSGLFSIAAALEGAAQVVGIDIDPISIQTSEENAKRFMDDTSGSTFTVCSILDNDKMSSLGEYDIVYSWGVLHHTGNMVEAIKSAAKRVSPGGIFVIAIYNRHSTSIIWLGIKKAYNYLPDIFRRAAVLLIAPLIFTAKYMVTRKNPLDLDRGMNFKHNVIDWLGGYPYEYASISEITILIEGLNLNISRIIPAQVPTGCNQYVCNLP